MESCLGCISYFLNELRRLSVANNRCNDFSSPCRIVIFGAEEGTRTPTAFPPPEPESGASANSATSAIFTMITSTKKSCQQTGFFI